MEQTGQSETLVIGHKNPDTDSICSAIVYAALKEKLTGKPYRAVRAGSLSPETQFVLQYFGVSAPELVESVRTQVRDISVRKSPVVGRGTSLKNAWNLMQENNVITLPCVSEEGFLDGIITMGDITTSYMNMNDSSILSMAHTKYANICDTLEAEIAVGNAEDCFTKGKVLIAAANPDLMENDIKKHDLVILGNRYESQFCAIEMGADCLIVCSGAEVPLTIRKLAEERGCTIMTTPYDTYRTARMINLSMPVDYFMTKDRIVAFSEEDTLDDIRETMATLTYRDFPILDEDGRYLGMIARGDLLGVAGKHLILVDHNEKSQAVEGIEEADIEEILDHHRLQTVETVAPISFRNEPLGCTATIIYQIYEETGTKIDPVSAGLLSSAIISDTLLFRSPTCTEKDREAALALAPAAGIDLTRYAEEMFAAGSNLSGMSDEEIFYQDYKRFNAGHHTFGIGQIFSLDASGLESLKDRLLAYEKKVLKQQNTDMMFFMLTNILTESTELVCAGSGACALIRQSFQLEMSDAGTDQSDGFVNLPGVVSRKKQLVPKIMTALSL